MNWEALAVGIGILGLFATTLIASIGGTAAILWQIAKIDKEKVDWTACQHMREQCPCKQDIHELKKISKQKE